MRNRRLVTVIAAGLVARVAFWIYTQRVWEDALITLNNPRNALDGVGLTHHAGEGHVYSFTSTLSVLIPLVSDYAWRDSGLWAMRLTALLAFAMSAIYAYLLCDRLAIGRWPTVFVLVFLGLDRLQIFYGMAGMESQVAVAILLAATYYVYIGSAWRSGLALGLCALARPDLVLLAGPLWLWLLLKDRAAAIKSGFLAAALNMPWLLFALLYYGTIVPQSIQGKYGSYVDPPRLDHPLQLAGWLAGRLHEHSDLWQIFTPAYSQALPTAATAAMVPVALITIPLAVLGAWRMIQLGFWPLPVYAVLFLVYRVLFLLPVYYEWYLPPFAAVCAILIGAGIATVANRWHSLSVAGLKPAPALAVFLAAVFAIHLPVTFAVEQRRQQVEEHVRVPVGEYLATAAKPGDAVGSESAGYIGFYSRAKIYDYPGITSRASFEVLRAAPVHDRTLQYMVAKLQPEWVVFRPFELELYAANYPDARSHYTVVKTFTYSDNQVFGIRVSGFDSTFYLLHRQG